jgi:hypothetical protein
METAVITESDVDVLTGERRISDEAGVKINVFLEKYNSVKYGGRSGPVEKARFKKVIEQSVDILASMDKKAGEEENSEKKNIV